MIASLTLLTFWNVSIDILGTYKPIYMEVGVVNVLQWSQLPSSSQYYYFCHGVTYWVGYVDVGSHWGTAPVLELGAKIHPVPALDVFLPVGALCINGVSSSSTGCPVAAPASLTLTINPFLIGRVPQQGEKWPVLELNEFLRPVLELEWCPNGTQHRQDNCIWGIFSHLGVISHVHRVI